MYSSRLIAVAAAVTLVGCSAFPTKDSDADPEAIDQTRKVDIHAPFPVLYRDGIEQVKLVELLAGASEGGNIRKMKSDKEDPVNGISWSTKYDLAFAAFYKRLEGEVVAQKLERNRIQERILAASDQRCRVFKVALQRDQARSNFWLGTLATLSGAAGGVVEAATGARILSATAGLLSGVRAEYNQDFYANLLFAVITKGIEERRREAYQEIQRNGQTKAIAAYPVEAAVKDAILYDSLCNTGVGLQQAQDSIRLAADPGIDAMNRYLIKANLTRTILEKQIADQSQLEKAGTDLQAGVLVSKGDRTDFGSQLTSSEVSPETEVDALVRSKIAQIDAAVKAASAALQPPSAMSTSDLGTIRNGAQAEISKYSSLLYSKYVACVRKDGAEAVKQLLVARSERIAAENSQNVQARDKAEASEKAIQGQLDAISLGIRQLSGRFLDGLKEYSASLQKSVADWKAPPLPSVTASASLTAQGKGRWDFGSKDTCSESE